MTFVKARFDVSTEDGWTNMRRWLVARRKRARLTQKQVAERMHCSQSTVSDFERGAHDPHVSTIADYMHAIGLRGGWSLIPKDEQGLTSPE